MGDAVDLTGDGGVVKTIVRHAKGDAVAPTEDLPLVDGMVVSGIHLLLLYLTCQKVKERWKFGCLVYVKNLAFLIH